MELYPKCSPPTQCTDFGHKKNFTLKSYYNKSQIQQSHPDYCINCINRDKAKLPLYLTNYEKPWKCMGEWLYRSYCLDVGTSWSGWLASNPGHFIPRERASSTNWTGRWVGYRAGMDDIEIKPFLTLWGLELRPLCCPTHHHLQYWLLYSGSL
jgi:hypothetical protein